MQRSAGKPTLRDMDHNKRSEKYVGYARELGLCLYDGSFFRENDWGKDKNGVLLNSTYTIFDAGGREGVRPAMWARL